MKKFMLLVSLLLWSSAAAMHPAPFMTLYIDRMTVDDWVYFYYDRNVISQEAYDYIPLDEIC